MNTSRLLFCPLAEPGVLSDAAAAGSESESHAMPVDSDKICEKKVSGLICKAVCIWHTVTVASEPGLRVGGLAQFGFQAICYVICYGMIY